MTGDQGFELLWGIGALALVGSALFARRIPIGRALAMLLAWAAIFALGAVLFAFRGEIGDKWRMMRAGEAGVATGETLRIPMDEDGHFWVRARVNGVEARFLVDSGASVTGLSAATLAAARIVDDGRGFPMLIETANGTIRARRVRIAELGVGPIERRDLAAITAPEFGETNVLGMNFLSTLDSWGVERRVLVLKP